MDNEQRHQPLLRLLLIHEGKRRDSIKIDLWSAAPLKNEWLYRTKGCCAAKFPIGPQMLINALIFLHTALALSFRYIPDAISTLFAAIIALGYVLVIISYMLSGLRPGDYGLMLPIIAIVMLWGLSLLDLSQVDGSTVAWASAARQLSVFVCFLAIFFMRNAISERLLVACTVSIVLSGLLHAIFADGEYLNGYLRLAPFADGLHTSGYLLAGCLILSLELYRTKAIGRMLALFLVAVAAILIVGNGVRTPIVLLMCILFYSVAFNISVNKAYSFLGMIISFTLVALGATYTLFVDINEISDFSSGRVFNYIERFRILSERPMISLLIGSGPGTDLLRTDVWWWDEKDSHSDLLKYLWEAGILGLGCVLFWFTQIMRSRGISNVGLVFGIFVACAISNALLSRPNAAFLFFAVLALRASRVRND